MDLPNESPPAYEAPYTKRYGAPEMPHTSLPVVPKPNYPFHRLRWWVVGTVARLLAWEPSNYACDVNISIEKDGQDRVLTCGGLLDTGLFTTVLCRTTAERMEKFGATIMEYPDGKEAIFVTSNGTPFYSIGKIKARIRVDGGLRYVDREWEVSEKPLDFCEALIGTDLLNEFGRFVLFGAAGSPIVESKPRPASRIEIQQAQQARSMARDANPPRINELRNNYLQGGGNVTPYAAATQPVYGAGRQYGGVRR